MSYGELPSIKNLEQALTKAKSPVSVYAVHGMLNGMFCAGLAFDSGDWQAQLLALVNDGDSLEPLGMTALEAMHQQVAVQFGERITVTILLPEFGQNFNEKLAALAQWCDGWLSGFGAIWPHGEQMDKDAKETIYEIKEFANVDTNTDQEVEADEAAFQLVLDHLSQAVEFLFDSFGAAPDNTRTN